MGTRPLGRAWGLRDRSVPRCLSKPPACPLKGLLTHHLSMSVGCSPMGVRRQHPTFDSLPEVTFN